MATHSSILAWKISGTEDSGGLQSVGSQRVGCYWMTNTYLLTWALCMHMCTKLLQSCLTHCDSMDCSLTGSSLLGILKNTEVSCHALLQGTFLTQGLNPRLMPPALAGGSLPLAPFGKPSIRVCVNWLVMSNSATPWTIAHQAPLPRRFSRQEYWKRLPFPSPGDLPNPGIKPGLLHYRQTPYHLSQQESPMCKPYQLSTKWLDIQPQGEGGKKPIYNAISLIREIQDWWEGAYSGRFPESLLIFKTKMCATLLKHWMWYE